MFQQFSLCIPTMKRWSFLKESLPNYLENPYVGEIILVDETGEDYEIISQMYSKEPKIKIFRNETRIGPFLNKLECMKHASFDWIALIDSDNYADRKYFETLLRHFDPYKRLRVYMPSRALPNFDYSAFSGMTLTFPRIAELIRGKQDLYLTTCFNTGNYILSKQAYTLLNQYRNDELSKISFCCDVIYANTLLLCNQFDFYVVPHLEYSHVAHEGSVYFEYIGQSRPLSEFVQKQFVDLALKT
jgi:glycosyltransferase involved in cell wall biosynthesis